MFIHNRLNNSTCYIPPIFMGLRYRFPPCAVAVCYYYIVNQCRSVLNLSFIVRIRRSVTIKVSQYSFFFLDHTSPKQKSWHTSTFCQQMVAVFTSPLSNPNSMLFFIHPTTR